MREIFVAVTVIAAVFLSFIVLGILTSLWSAWWLFPAWAWFIVPLGVPQISFWHFMAINSIVGAYRTYKIERKHTCDIELSWWDAASPWVTVVAGAPITFWILAILHNLG